MSGEPVEKTANDRPRAAESADHFPPGDIDALAELVEVGWHAAEHIRLVGNTADENPL